MSGSGNDTSPPQSSVREPDAETSGDVARWRRAERKRLAGLRDALGQEGRAQASRDIAAHLEKALSARGLGHKAVLSGYWPIKGEPDLRPLLAALHGAGVVIALPVVVQRAAPLVFRHWTPDAKMIRGDWNIPVPPPDAEELRPDMALAPCLGWDGGCYRLGWGGGYFDRTLAALTPRPLTIGIALSAARLPSIHPQPHDIPLDLIVTETGVSAERAPGR